VPLRHAPRQRRRTQFGIGRNVPSYWQKRYAEDPEYREKKLAYGRAYRAAHKEETSEEKRERWKNDPEFRDRIRASNRKSHLKNSYGLSLDDYNAMRKRQRGRCRICRTNKRKLCVDHKGKIVRGLLCDPCNLGLGLFRDDPRRMRRAIAYVKASSPAPRGRRKKNARRKR
jgi:Autographiviridae endonuclease VII